MFSLLCAYFSLVEYAYSYTTPVLIPSLNSFSGLGMRLRIRLDLASRLGLGISGSGLRRCLHKNSTLVSPIAVPHPQPPIDLPTKANQPDLTKFRLQSPNLNLQELDSALQLCLHGLVLSGHVWGGRSVMIIQPITY